MTVTLFARISALYFLGVTLTHLSFLVGLRLQSGASPLRGSGYAILDEPMIGMLWSVGCNLVAGALLWVGAPFLDKQAARYRGSEPLNAASLQVVGIRLVGLGMACFLLPRDLARLFSARSDDMGVLIAESLIALLLILGAPAISDLITLRKPPSGGD